MRYNGDMKRYIAVFLTLVILDQLLGWAANAAFANGEFVAIGSVVIGRWDHAVPIITFAAPLTFEIVGMFILAALFRVGLGEDFYKLFGLPIALLAATLATQTIDMLARGYAVNYMGILSHTNDWEVVKLTDTTWRLAMLYFTELMVAGFIISALRGVTHGKTNKPVMG